MERYGVYILFLDDGRVSGRIHNKRNALRFARKLAKEGNAGEVRRVGRSYFRGYHPFGHDYPTFRVSSDVVHKF